MDNHYTYRVVWSPEDEEFVGLVAEFPSLSWLDKDRGEAFAGIVQLVDDVLADMEETEETPPTPLSERSYSGKFLVRSSPALHQRLTAEAAEQGVSLNQWVVQKLSAEPRAATPYAPVAMRHNPPPFEVALATELCEHTTTGGQQDRREIVRQRLSDLMDVLYGPAVQHGFGAMPLIYGTDHPDHSAPFSWALSRRSVVIGPRDAAHADDESSFHPH